MKFRRKPLFVLLTVLIIIVQLTYTACSRNEEKYAIDDTETQTQSDNLFSDYIYDNNLAQLQSGSRIAIAEDGYYMVLNGYLYYYDIKTETMSACCYNATCKHSSSTCDAYIQQNNEINKCYDNIVLYYDNMLYMIENDNNSVYYLNQYNSRFGDEKRIAVLADNSDDSITTSISKGEVFKIKDGYLYYMYYTFEPNTVATTRSHICKCMRIRLSGDSKPEIIGEFSGKSYDASGFKLLVDDDYVYYAQGDYGTFVYGNASGYVGVSYHILGYNTVDGTTNMIIDYLDDSTNDVENVFGSGSGYIEAVDNTWCVDLNSNIFFLTYNALGSTGFPSILRYSQDSNAAERIYSCQGEVNSLMSDGKYIYLIESSSLSTTPETAIVIIDANGDVIRRIVLESESGESIARDVYMIGTDDRYITIYSTQSGLKGLSSNKTFSGIGIAGCALIDKQKLIDGEDVELLQIYAY